MKIKYLALSAALAALLGAAVSAHAAGITVNSGDLVLGFQDGTNSIQFDIGNVAGTLSAQDGATTDLGFNVNTALSYTGSGTTGYGASWASNGGIVYGIAGKDANSFYTGMREDSPSATLAGGAATPNSFATLVPGDAGPAASSLGTLINAMGTAPTASQLKAGGSNILAIKYLNSSGNSFSHIDPNSAAAAFGGTFLPSVDLNTVVTNTTVGTAGLLNGLTYSALDLHEYTDNGVGGVVDTFLGTLALTTGGELFFTSAFASSIPEPSTYAAILGVVTLGIAAVRRRKQEMLAV